MRAAVLRAYGSAPDVEERPAPDAPTGHALVDVLAAPITPLDILCATGTSYFGTPALPYVPGVQGVGVVRAATSLPAGTVVWFATSAGMQPGDGSLASSLSVPEADVVAIEGDVPPALVAALGLSAVAAWMGLTWRGELHAGEQVIVLGAGGVVGQVAVQVARLQGARRVIAACRSDSAAERAGRCRADEVVRLDADDIETLVQRFKEACDGPADLVLDPLFGPPAAAALRALRPGGRLVNLGESAAPTATIDSATLRGRSLRLLGYTNNELTAGQRRAALTAILRHAAHGELTVDHETLPLEQICSAWGRQAQGSASARLVIDPHRQFSEHG
jgi:NADPH:quinone reductase